jgi:hypothetical protein
MMSGVLSTSPFTTSEEVLPQQTCHEFANTHSLSVSVGIGAAEETALMWNPEVAKVIVEALRASTPPPQRSVSTHQNTVATSNRRSVP